MERYKLLYRAQLSYIIEILDECCCHEYSIVSEDGKRCLCATEDQQFLYIDVEKNKKVENVIYQERKNNEKFMGYEAEIHEAISHLKITDEVEELTGDERDYQLFLLRNQFVEGDPYAWWLSLKYQATYYQCDSDYTQINRFFGNQEKVWLVVVQDNLLYRAKVSHIIDIIGESSFYEYSVISEDGKRCLCETEDGDFLYIDIDKNEKR